MSVTTSSMPIAITTVSTVSFVTFDVIDVLVTRFSHISLIVVVIMNNFRRRRRAVMFVSFGVAIAMSFTIATMATVAMSMTAVV